MGRRLVVLCCLTVAVAGGFVSNGAGQEKTHGLRFLRPAEDSIAGWERESLPIGCGYVGANVFGIVGDERVQITHNAFLNPQAKGSLRGNLTNAEEIRIRCPEANVANYVRGLDLAWRDGVPTDVRVVNGTSATPKLRFRGVAFKPGDAVADFPAPPAKLAYDRSADVLSWTPSAKGRGAPSGLKPEDLD